MKIKIKSRSIFPKSVQLKNTQRNGKYIMNINFKSLNFKLISLVLLGISPLILLVFLYVFPVFETYLLNQRKAEVKTSVDIMIGVLDNMVKMHEADKKDTQKLKDDIQTLFTKVRYNETDYFFAYNSRGFGAAHGTKPEFINTDRSNSADADGKKYVQDFIKLVGDPEGGFVPYKFEKTKGGQPFPKISYVKYFAPLDWMVGTGLYIDVVEEQVSAVKTKVLIALLILSSITMFICWRYAQSICQKINSISHELHEEADKVSVVALDISKASESLSSSTTQQASALQETSSSIEETSAMINKNAENARSSLEISARSRDSVEQGKKMISELIVSINEISTSNSEMVKQIEESNKEIAEIVKVINEIGDKTKVINEIVFQTKLLSFNASVEAARAGEHGKGFAVVAEEVGNLAHMSGNSAKEISDLLGTSIKTVTDTIEQSKHRIEKLVVDAERKVTQGASIATKCGKVFDEIVSNVNNVNVMINDIASASNEQATGIREINSAVSELDNAGQENSTLSQKTADYAEQLRSQVDNLRHTSSELNKLIKGDVA